MLLVFIVINAIMIKAISALPQRTTNQLFQLHRVITPVGGTLENVWYDTFQLIAPPALVFQPKLHGNWISERAEAQSLML